MHSDMAYRGDCQAPGVFVCRTPPFLSLPELSYIGLVANFLTLTGACGLLTLGWADWTQRPCGEEESVEWICAFGLRSTGILGLLGFSSFDISEEHQPTTDIMMENHRRIAGNS